MTDTGDASSSPDPDTAEHRRLAEARTGIPWKRWGPYLSERQWGGVREDTSVDGDAWDSFPHDQARSRAYRWGEDGLFGFSDDQAQLCFSLALWNGVDPILKERLFGLTNSEGNHGEDVKEYYFYLDATPTSSYLKELYKYPLVEYPYLDLVRTNASRGYHDFEYELIDTGVFDDDRYVDVEVEYAKAAPDDVCVLVTLHNRGADDAGVHVLPTLWFRNTWAWGGSEAEHPKPALTRVEGGHETVVRAEHHALGTWHLYGEAGATPLFTENETNTERIENEPNAQPYVKDAFHRYLVDGDTSAVNPAGTGTKCALHQVVTVPAGGSSTVRLRLCVRWPDDLMPGEALGDHHAAALATRRAEADEFYDAITPASASPDDRQILRQALSGMLWTCQYYAYDVSRWLHDRGVDQLDAWRAKGVRNHEWIHFQSGDVISMPDKWEYPWFAAWDLAFHTLPLDLVDPDLAKKQLELVLTELYAHPNGQVPAYEWNFSDVNPPVQAWAAYYLHRSHLVRHGEPDLEWLTRVFRELLVNYTWWLNRKDPTGRNVFEGGFLGLDNIGVFDRSKPLPTGGFLEQADGTAWMALFTQNMLQLSVELASHDDTYEPMILRFLSQFFRIALAMDRGGENDDDLWDDQDGFFYDVLRLPDGDAVRLKVRSYVGLLPLCASTVFEPSAPERFPRLRALIHAQMERGGKRISNLADPLRPGVNGRRLLALLDEPKLRATLARMLDEDEFLGPSGIRSVSKVHEDEPYTFWVGGEPYEVRYLPAESDSGMFGGNSNWRGPVWVPINLLILRALLHLHAYYGDEFTVECPTGSGVQKTLFGVAQEIGHRLLSPWRRDAAGRRPVYGDTEKFQSDPHWRDLLLFYEYFNGDDGAGLGASHQTGWTGAGATVVTYLDAITSERLLLVGDRAIRRS